MARRRAPSIAAPGHAWNPSDYAANASAQRAWAHELMTRLALQGNEHILDVGCGDGAITAELARAVPRGGVLGIDSSAEMIQHARQSYPLPHYPNLAFAVMDARAIRLEDPVDRVFSNAALHWIDDHRAFLRGAAAALRPGGGLCISCGGRGNAEQVFRAMRAVMRDSRWRSGFKAMPRPYHFHGPEAYSGWLKESGLSPLSVRLQPRDMIQPHRAAFAGWVRTTWLPYTERVPTALRETFITALIDRYLALHPPDSENRIRVRMVRLEIEAVKPVRSGMIRLSTVA